MSPGVRLRLVSPSYSLAHAWDWCLYRSPEADIIGLRSSASPVGPPAPSLTGEGALGPSRVNVGIRAVPPVPLGMEDSGPSLFPWFLLGYLLARAPVLGSGPLAPSPFPLRPLGLGEGREISLYRVFPDPS